MNFEDWAWMLLESVSIVTGLLIAIWLGISAVSWIVKAIRNFGR